MERNEEGGGSRHKSFHAIEKMADDLLGILDIECAILNGKITNRERDDPRGTKYVIKGRGIDNATPIGVVGRFKE